MRVAKRHVLISYATKDSLQSTQIFNVQCSLRKSYPVCSPSSWTRNNSPTPSHSLTKIAPLFTDTLSCQLWKKYKLFPGARVSNPQEFPQLNPAIVERLESLVNDDDGQSAGWHCLQIRISTCQEPHYAGNRNLRSVIHHDFSKFVGGVPSIACLTNPLGECRVCPSSMTMEGQKNFRYVPKCAGLTKTEYQCRDYCWDGAGGGKVYIFCPGHSDLLGLLWSTVGSRSIVCPSGRYLTVDGAIMLFPRFGLRAVDVRT